MNRNHKTIDRLLLAVQRHAARNINKQGISLDGSPAALLVSKLTPNDMTAILIMVNGKTRGLPSEFYA